jgi:hypothetical protein
MMLRTLKVQTAVSAYVYVYVYKYILPEFFCNSIFILKLKADCLWKSGVLYSIDVADQSGVFGRLEILKSKVY